MEISESAYSWENRREREDGERRRKTEEVGSRVVAYKDDKMYVTHTLVSVGVDVWPETACGWEQLV